MRPIALLLSLTLAAPAAQAFTAQNGLIVRPDGAEGFSIPWRGPSGPTDFWCAAGDYAIRALHLPPTAPIFRASEPPRRSGAPMTFTLAADRAAATSGLLLIGPDDAGLSARAAQSYCEFRKKPR